MRCRDRVCRSLNVEIAEEHMVEREGNKRGYRSILYRCKKCGLEWRGRK
jgi:hypothetical protein